MLSLNKVASHVPSFKKVASRVPSLGPFPSSGSDQNSLGRLDSGLRSEHKSTLSNLSSVSLNGKSQSKPTLKQSKHFTWSQCLQDIHEVALSKMRNNAHS